MTMLERVARAIWQENKPQDAADYDELDYLDQGRVKMIARACIQEMREPTNKMADTANDAFPDAPNETTCRKLGCDIYRAMIDCALKEESH